MMLVRLSEEDERPRNGESGAMRRFYIPIQEREWRRFFSILGIAATH
jgi:hypothetical protein